MKTVRPMHPEDHADVAAIWHEGWHDAHAGLVPDALTALRGPDAFVKAVPNLTKTVWVGCLDAVPGGFVAWENDEIAFLFLARSARGTGLAQALMACAEKALIQAGHQTATLDYVKGNARAARFYARSGWTIVREEEDSVSLEGIETPSWMSVICQKDLAPAQA